MKKVIDNTNLGYLIGKEKAAFWQKTESLNVVLDDVPTENSNNLVKSGGVYDAIEDVLDAIDGTNVETVTVLPTASASTVGKIYYVGPDSNGDYARYRGIESGGSYSFLSLGSTEMDLTNYATEGEVDQLEQLLEVDDHSGTVTERIGYGQHIGYIGTNGAINNQTAGNNRYSDPIHLKAGDSLKINAISATNVARLSSWNVETGLVISVLAVGQSAGGTYPTDMYENTYTATEDIDVVVGWNYVGPLELTKTYYKSDVSSRMDDLDAVETALDMQEESGTTTAPVALTLNENEYLGFSAVGKGCSRSSNNYYETSVDFLAKRGDIITVVASNVGTNVTLLAYNDGVQYRTIAGGNNTTDQTVTYTVPYDQALAVCFSKSNGGTVTLTRTAKRTWSQRLDDMEVVVDALEPLPGRVSTLEGKATPVLEDDMTTGYVENYFINHNGAISGNSSFGYKEFTVRAGAVIVITSAEHPNIAAISKKVGEGKYVELVPATTQESATHTYIASEDMTIAVSFYQTQDRSITISTDYINSNRLNIVALQQKDASDEMRDIDLGFLFNKIAVIGDSMSAATMDGYTPPLGASWLSFLAKRWASVGKEWYAMGGTSAYDWLNNSTYGLGKLLADETIYNCYFIAYGHNDSATVGEATDEAAPVTITDGVPSCPDGYSFCAYYKAIINQIRTKAPHAMIFCLSQYDYSVAPGGWHSQYGEAVVDVAELIYNGGDKLVHHLDTGGVPVSNMDIGGHYSTIGYAYIAKRINDEANKVIYQYRADTEIKTFGVYNL